MSEPTKNDGIWVNSNLVTENFNKFPAEEILKHAGQYVAFSLDGSVILASGADEMEAEARVTEMGINPAHVIVMYIQREGEETLI